jgi:DNA invertase Pin-like site-specific DNA recombinase
MLLGYARVSTNLQETHLQLDALKAAGVVRIFAEKTSSVGQRPQLQAALQSLCAGDVLMVYKLDRVARSLKDLLNILEAVHHAGAKFRSLTEPIDTTSAVGEFIVQILGAVGQFERALIRERAIAGQVAAYKRGTRWGGQPRVLGDDDAGELARLRREFAGLFTIPMLADIFGCSEATVWRYIWIADRPGAAKLRRLPVLGQYVNGG